MAARHHRWLVGAPGEVSAAAAQVTGHAGPTGHRAVVYEVGCGRSPLRQARASRELLRTLVSQLYATPAWDRHRGMISALAPEVLRRVDERIGDDLIAAAFDTLITHPHEAAYSDVEVQAWGFELTDLLIQVAANNGDFGVLIHDVDNADPCDAAIIAEFCRQLPAELVQITVTSRTEDLPGTVRTALRSRGVRPEHLARSR